MRELRLRDEQRDGKELVRAGPPAAGGGAPAGGPTRGRAQVFEGQIVEGDARTCGHVIRTTAGSGPSRQTISYQTERVVGNGSFGVVFQATCLETGETVRRPGAQRAAPPAAPSARGSRARGAARAGGHKEGAAGQAV